MTNETIIRILEQHSIGHNIASDNRLYAAEEYTERRGSEVIGSTEWIEVTGWSRRQLYDWLGY